MEEKRRTRRHRTYKGARIIFRAYPEAIRCIVRNLSEGGACLHIEGPEIGIPDTFRLVFDRSAPERRCSVVWRDEGRLGVEFF